jgi:CheY-like chemotaxis protein
MNAGTATRVLVVEDDPVDALAARRSLLSGGPGGRFEIRHAKTLAESFERLHAEPVDVLLLDLFLPDSEGVETVARLRREAPRVPLVVFTSSDAPQLAAGTLAAGADEHLVKGSSEAAELRESLVRAMRRYAGGAARGLAEVRPLARSEDENAVRRIDLARFVADVEPLLRRLVPVQVSIRLSISDDPPPAIANGDRLFFTLLELVANAVSAIGEREGVLELRTGSRGPQLGGSALVLGDAGLAAGPHAWLEIRDTGRGFVAASVLEEARAAVHDSNEYGESHVAEMLRGGEASLVVESQPGCGSTFRILVPVCND